MWSKNIVFFLNQQLFIWIILTEPLPCLQKLNQMYGHLPINMSLEWWLRMKIFLMRLRKGLWFGVSLGVEYDDWHRIELKL